MDSVRGQDKNPGEFRKEQNWIGRAGCTIEQATFVPPNPVQLTDYLIAWEQYLDSDDIDFLIQAADPVDEQAKDKAALTELFAEVKSGKTPMVIERIVTDIDEIVRLVRFPGWQNT